jgi:tetratricopeptide (TPR) repeat protein
MALPTKAYRQAQTNHWQDKYYQHLEQRLQVTLKYILTSSYAEIRSHLRSLLATLDEARRYPDLYPLILNVIAALHPLPLRWGFGYLWQSQLSFALQQESDASQLAVYHNALAEIYFFSGSFELAITESRAVQSLKQDQSTQTARAGRMLFNCHRSMGNPNRADQVLKKLAGSFHLKQNIHQINEADALGWLILQQCQLEQLREQGKTEDALTLVNDMLQLDGQLGSPDPILTADLTTRRSTLLWMRGAFQGAVEDLLHAVDLYNSEEDIFNAEALQSNLGLVYWSMGELKRAEASLQSSIAFYRKSGADQLITHDIGNMGLVHFARGHLQAALNTTREHIAHAGKLGFVSEHNRGRRNLGTILYYFGKYEKALEELCSNQDYYEQRGSREGYTLDFVWSACCHYQMGQKEKALADIRQVLEWSVKNSSSVLEAVTRRSLAYFLPLEDPSRLSHLERCLALSKTQERQLEKAAVLLTMAQAMPAAERELTWQAGADLLTRIGAEAWLEGHSIDNPPYIPTLV